MWYWCFLYDWYLAFKEKKRMFVCIYFNWRCKLYILSDFLAIVTRTRLHKTRLALTMRPFPIEATASWKILTKYKYQVQTSGGYCDSEDLNMPRSYRWAQVEWWLEHRHSWLVKPQWAGSTLGRMTRDEYQVLGSTSIPARLDTLVYWEPFSWLTGVGTNRNTVIRLGWSRIGLAVPILYAAGAGLIGRPAVISGRYNKCHSLQLHNHYAHFPPLQHTHTHTHTHTVMQTQLCVTGRGKWSWVSRHCMLAVAGGILCDRVKRPIGH